MKEIIRNQYRAMKPADLLKAVEYKSSLLDAHTFADWKNLLPDCDTRVMFEVAEERGILVTEW